MARLLVLTSMYPPQHLGGYELQCHDAVRASEAAGHEVHVLCSDVRHPGRPEPRPADEPRVRRSLRMYWRDHELLEPPWRDRLAIEHTDNEELRRAIAELHPDVVSVWQLGAMPLSLVATLVEAGVPAVFVVCDDWLLYGPRVDPWTAGWHRVPRPLRERAARVLGTPTSPGDIGGAGRFVFCSETTRRRAEEHGAWAFPDAHVVHLGVDTHDFPILGSADERPWTWRLLAPGRIDERKGLADAIGALALLPDEATLDIVGWGDAHHLAELRSLAVTLGVHDRVRFDAVERADLRERYLAASCTLFPVVWDEPFGIVPLEAMASGSPVVATGRGGSGEFLRHDGNSLLFPAGDRHALAAAVRLLARDPALRTRLVSAGLETAAATTSARTASALLAHHLDVIGTARPRPGSTAVQAMRTYWDRKARTNAAWYVDTSLDFDAPDMNRFFETGARVVAHALDDAPALPAEHGRAVEIGCGLGRICLSLRERFDQVVGFDIAPEMVRQAGALVTDPAISFVTGDGATLRPLEEASVDFVLSFTVFQHIPDPAVIESYIVDAGRVLRPGGVLAFQWNNQAPPWRWRLQHVVARHRPERFDRNDPAFVGTTVATSRIRAAVEAGGCSVDAIRGDGTLWAWCWATRR
jgi:glycogen(starch) synthase